VFQEARRRAIENTVLLGRASIFGHDENDGLQEIPRAGCPCGEGEDGREESTGQLHTRLDGEVIAEIRDFVEWGGGRLVEDDQFRGYGFGGRGLDTRGCFLLCLHIGRLSGCWRLWLGLLRPSHLPGGCHFWLRRNIRDVSMPILRAVFFLT